MEAVAEDSRPATRCAQAVVAALTDQQLPMTLIGAIYDELGKVSPKSGATTTGRAVGASHERSRRDFSRGDVVVDPACGEGQLLFAAAGRQPDLTLIGRDKERICTDTAWALFRLGHLDAEVGPVEDSLRQIDEIPPGDVVLLDPPIAKGAHVRRWLTLATQLCPRGRIVIALPGNTLRPGRREWPQVRDRVVAVIACPAGSKSDTGDATAVWVLGPSAPDQPILVVNAAPERSSQLTIDDARELASAVIDWRRTGSWNASPGMTVRAEEFPRLKIDAAGGELRLKGPSLEILGDGPLRPGYTRHVGRRLRRRPDGRVHDLDATPSTEGDDYRPAAAGRAARFVAGAGTSLVGRTAGRAIAGQPSHRSGESPGRIHRFPPSSFTAGRDLRPAATEGLTTLLGGSSSCGASPGARSERRESSVGERDRSWSDPAFTD